MTSILNPEAYYDRIILTKGSLCSLEERPIAPLLKLVFNYEDKTPYWSRDYKAFWVIDNDKLFLTNVNGKINRTALSVSYLGKYLDLSIKKGDFILASWYSGLITAKLSEDNDQKIVTSKFKIFEVVKGVIVSTNYKIEKTDWLPF